MKMSLRMRWVVVKSLKTPLRNIKMAPYVKNSIGGNFSQKWITKWNHGGRKKSLKRIRNVTLLLGTSEYLFVYEQAKFWMFLSGNSTSLTRQQIYYSFCLKVQVTLENEIEKYVLGLTWPKVMHTQISRIESIHL